MKSKVHVTRPATATQILASLHLTKADKKAVEAALKEAK